MAETVPWPQSNWACFSITEDKLKAKRATKHSVTELSGRQGQAKHLNRGNLSMSMGSILQAVIAYKGFASKCYIIFIIACEVEGLCNKWLQFLNSSFIIFVKTIESKVKVYTSFIYWVFYFICKMWWWCTEVKWENCVIVHLCLEITKMPLLPLIQQQMSVDHEGFSLKKNWNVAKLWWVEEWWHVSKLVGHCLCRFLCSWRFVEIRLRISQFSFMFHMIDVWVRELK